MPAVTRVVVDVRNVPEVMADLRREVAKVLRATAEREVSGYVRERLGVIADDFETGASAT